MASEDSDQTDAQADLRLLCCVRVCVRVCSEKVHGDST